MSKEILQLRRDRQAKIQEAKHILATADEQKRGMNEQEAQDYDAAMVEIESLASEIERREKLASFEQDSSQFRPDPSPEIGMNEQETRQYSLLNAIRAAASNDWRGAELEREASEAVAKRLGLTPKGFFVPYEVQTRNRAQRERRDLNVGTPTAGGNLVATDLLSQSFIDLLRNRMVVQQAGATVLTGLVGNIAIPKQTGGGTAYWVAEGADVTESQQTIGQVPLTPRTLGAYTDYTRNLLLQSSIDVEAFVRGDLAAVLQLEIDRAALHGTGAANQPTGIANTAGIGAPGTAAASEALVVDLETAVAVDNADVGRLAYMTNATVRGALKKADIGTDTGSRVWDARAGNTPVNGYPAWVTNQVETNKIFFGNWADLIIGFWSGLDIMVNPYTLSTSGSVRVVALQDVDVAVRHAESFAMDATSA